jgi:hypothetical protein
MTLRKVIKSFENLKNRVVRNVHSCVVITSYVM